MQKDASKSKLTTDKLRNYTKENFDKYNASIELVQLSKKVYLSNPRDRLYPCLSKLESKFSLTYRGKLGQQDK